MEFNFAKCENWRQEVVGFDKKMQNKGTNKIDLIKVDEKIVTSDKEIAEALADQYVKNHSLTINYKLNTQSTSK